LDAPTDRGAKARVTWLTRQLKDSGVELTIESYAKNVRNPQVEWLVNALEDPSKLIGEDRRDPVKFRVVFRTDMGSGQRSGKKPGVVRSVVRAIEEFYFAVLQDIVPYQPKAARIADKPEVPPYLSSAPTGGAARLDPPVGIGVNSAPVTASDSPPPTWP
jgi:hypothetical protein